MLMAARIRRKLFLRWRNNGLSITLFVLFVAFLIGQSFAGWHEQNAMQLLQGGTPQSYGSYLGSGAFLEATMENWESEFLQMFVYVIFTVFLFQKGSSESKSPDKPSAVDRNPRLGTHQAHAPWPVRHGGWILKLYENSLSLAFLLLFLLSFFLHALGGMENLNEERILRGQPPLQLLQHLTGSRFWFESLQNWQSEFLAIWTMVVLSIYLRQRGSPESKPVDSPHEQTGTE